MRRLTWARATIVFASFFVLALLQAWPLPLHLSTHLTGPPSGDTGVYVWNTWVFRHELLEHGAWPFRTSEIFVGDRAANLTHHNYTLFANLLVLPIRLFAGVVASFNLVYFLNITLAAFGMFLLARRVTARDAEAWLAGALFACSAFMIGRSTGHFSLVAAAPLPFFVLCLTRCWEYRRTTDALLLGLAAAWSVTADPYYAMYCLMLAAGFLLSHAFAISPASSRARGWKRAATVLAILAAGVVVGRLITGGGVWRAGAFEISVRSLYTPVLLLTAALAVRMVLALRVQWSHESWPRWTTCARLTAVALVSAGFITSPVLSAYALGDAMDAPPVLWRSGPQGADLLAMILPHWSHPLMPSSLISSFARHPGGLIEQSASLSLVALAVIGVAIWRTTWRPSLRWSVAAVAFALMTMGPFVHVAGINTHIPTPWTLARYVPLISEARMPSRMAVVATMAVAMLFAAALGSLTSRAPKGRPWMLLAAAVLLWVDLWPAPRTLYAAVVPSIYQQIASDPRPVSVLPLPTGVLDGLGAEGSFTAHAQFFQTIHGKPIVGGYLSRTTPRRREAHAAHPLLGPLVALSANQPITEAQWAGARIAAPGFVKDVNLGYVVINHERASPELERFARDVLGLTRLRRDANRSLYAPFGTKTSSAGSEAGPVKSPQDEPAAKGGDEDRGGR